MTQPAGPEPGQPQPDHIDPPGDVIQKALDESRTQDGQK